MTTEPMTTDPTLTAYRCVLAALGAWSVDCAQVMKDAAAQADQVISVLVHWLTGELQVLAALDEEERDELVTRAATTDNETLKARAIAYVESELADRVLGRAEEQFGEDER